MNKDSKKYKGLTRSIKLSSRQHSNEHQYSNQQNEEGKATDYDIDMSKAMWENEDTNKAKAVQNIAELQQISDRRHSEMTKTSRRQLKKAASKNRSKHSHDERAEVDFFEQMHYSVLVPQPAQELEVGNAGELAVKQEPLAASSMVPSTEMISIRHNS